jgi:hypothetical protein
MYYSLSVVNMYTLFTFTCIIHYIRIYNIYKASVNPGYNGSLLTWTVVCLTAAKFKPLILHEDVRGSGCIDPCFLGLGNSWGWSPSHPARFTPRERNSGTHWIGGWVGPWTTWRGENSCSYRDSNCDPSAVQPVARRYTDCGTQRICC